MGNGWIQSEVETGNHCGYAGGMVCDVGWRTGLRFYRRAEFLAPCLSEGAWQLFCVNNGGRGWDGDEFTMTGDFARKGVNATASPHAGLSEFHVFASLDFDFATRLLDMIIRLSMDQSMMSFEIHLHLAKDQIF